MGARSAAARQPFELPENLIRPHFGRPGAEAIDLFLGNVRNHMSIRYTERLVEAGIENSVGSVGDSYDNALAESIKGLYKTEVIRKRGPWRSIEAVEFATLEWVDWFNKKRILEPLGWVPPVEYEEAFYESRAAEAKAA
jgi:putative transposase